MTIKKTIISAELQYSDERRVLQLLVWVASLREIQVGARKKYSLAEKKLFVFPPPPPLARLYDSRSLLRECEVLCCCFNNKRSGSCGCSLFSISLPVIDEFQCECFFYTLSLWDVK